MSAIVGPNGAGKSTLVKAMLGLIPIDRGTVTLFGDPVRRHRHRIAYVPQRSDIDWSYPATVAEVTGMGRYPLGRLWRRTNARDRERVRNALRTVSLAGFEDRAIGALSGGQQQRVFLARAIAQEAAVVVLDEPFTAIDAVTESLLWRVLEEMARGGEARGGRAPRPRGGRRAIRRRRDPLRPAHRVRQRGVHPHRAEHRHRLPPAPARREIGGAAADCIRERSRRKWMEKQRGEELRGLRADGHSVGRIAQRNPTWSVAGPRP